MLTVVGVRLDEIGDWKTRSRTRFCRRRGIATALVSCIAEILRARGAERPEVTADPHALEVYRAAGFIDCGVAERTSAPRLAWSLCSPESVATIRSRYRATRSMVRPVGARRVCTVSAQFGSCRLISALCLRPCSALDGAGTERYPLCAASESGGQQ